MARASRYRNDASWSEACDCRHGVPPMRWRPPSDAGYPLPREPGPLSPQAEHTVAPVGDGVAAAAAAAVDDGGGARHAAVGGVVGGAVVKPVAAAAPPSYRRPRNFRG